MLFQSNEQCGRNSLQSSQPNTSMSINIVRSFQVRHSFQNLFILKKNHILDIFIDQSWRQMSDTITINTNILIGRWVQLLFQNPIHANHFADDKTIFNYRKVRSVDFDLLSSNFVDCFLPRHRHMWVIISLNFTKFMPIEHQ